MAMKVITSNKIIFNSNTCQSTIKRVIYLLDKYVSNHTHALIDRGANSRVTEEDMHVIFKTLGRIITI